MPRLPLREDSRGVGAVEFALLAPLFLALIFAVVQLGLVFFANAGLKNAVSEGARLASIYPRPTNSQIAARISSTKFGLDPAHLSPPTIVDGIVDGARYADITMTYNAPLDFIFYQPPPIRLVQTRRVFTHSPE